VRHGLPPRAIASDLWHLTARGHAIVAEGLLEPLLGVRPSNAPGN